MRAALIQATMPRLLPPPGRAAAGGMFCALVCVLLMLGLTSAVRAGSLRTLDGKTLEGEIRLDASGTVKLTPHDGQPRTFSLDDLLLVNFKTQDVRNEHWLSRDVGNVALPGSARFQGGSVALRGSGADMSGTTDDQFHFAWQTLKGDGQIVCRVASVARSHKNARAGVMFRAAADPASPYVAAAMQADDQGVFAYRSHANGHTHPSSINATAPGWLKLTRRGDNYTASISRDGQAWEQAGSQSFQMPREILAGIYVCAHNRNAVCTAVMDHVSMGALEDDQRRRFRGLVLRDGSELVCQVRSADDSVVRVWRDRDHEMSIPLSEVSRIVFNAPSHEHAARFNQQGRTGVLLNNGDFFEGSLESLRDNRLRVSSVLFGLRTFETWQIIGVVLKDLRPVPSRYQIALTDSSILRINELDHEKDQFSARVRGAGIVHFLPWEIVEIRAGSMRFASLLDLKPARIEAPAGGFAVDATTVGLPMSLAGQVVEHGLGLAPGAAVSYPLDGAYRLMLARLGVPDGVGPAAALRFVILGDGRELYRSEPRTSLSEPLPVTLTVSGVQKLVIRVEAAPGSFGGGGLVADPALVK